MEQEKSEPTDSEETIRSGGAGEGTAPYSAAGVPAEHPHGVLYQGEFETPSDGTAIAVRLHAQALAATGIPVLLRSFSGVVVSPEGIAEPVYSAGMPAEVQAEVGHLLTTDIAVLRPVIKHLVIRSAEHCRQVLMPKGAIPLDANNIEAQISMRDSVYSNTIVYSVWERDRIDPGIVKHLARVKQCWVPCEHNRAMLVASGVPAENVHVVPHPYRPDEPMLRLTKRPPNLHNGWKRYYSIGRWEPRKGFDQLIEAFLLAHYPGDRASLTIKYSGSGQWPGFYAATEAIGIIAQQSEAVRDKGWVTETINEHVTLIGGRVPRSMILKLHAENNIYVSSSHGEAHNFGCFDAKLAGNRVAYIPWGGVVDFTEARDIATTWGMGPVHPSYNWEHGAQWATYDTAALADAMASATVPSEFCTPAWFPEVFSMAAVGKKMRDLVDAALAR